VEKSPCLRRAGSAERRRSVRRDRDQWACLITRLDDRGQKLGDGGSAGGDDGARLGRFLSPAEREKSGAAFLKMPPHANQPRRLGPCERFEQCGIPRTRADDKFADACLETAFHHFDR
jgi:hypothetical protein